MVVKLYLNKFIKKQDMRNKVKSKVINNFVEFSISLSSFYTQDLWLMDKIVLKSPTLMLGSLTYP